jgi:S-adenosyl methyltransferase
MQRPNWIPAEVDLSRPSAARVYDCYLGGSHNLEVDRRMAREAISLWPDLLPVAGPAEGHAEQSSISLPSGPLPGETRDHPIP